VSNRRATTLIEVVVALAVGTLAVILVWGLFRMSHRMFHSTRKRLTSLQGAFMLLERFDQDLAQTVILERTEPLVEDNRERLTFCMVDGDASQPSGPDPKVVLKRVQYRRDKDSAYFVRQEGSDTWSFRAAQFEIILYNKPTPSAMRVPADEYITFRITCAAHDDIEANRGKGDENPNRRDREVVTLISTVGFHQRASEAAFPWWRANQLPVVGPQR